MCAAKGENAGLTCWWCGQVAVRDKGDHKPLGEKGEREMMKIMEGKGRLRQELLREACEIGGGAEMGEGKDTLVRESGVDDIVRYLMLEGRKLNEGKGGHAKGNLVLYLATVELPYQPRASPSRMFKAGTSLRTLLPVLQKKERRD